MGFHHEWPIVPLWVVLDVPTRSPAASWDGKEILRPPWSTCTWHRESGKLWRFKGYVKSYRAGFRLQCKNICMHYFWVSSSFHWICTPFYLILIWVSQLGDSCESVLCTGLSASCSIHVHPPHRELQAGPLSHMSVTMSRTKQSSRAWQSLVKHEPAGAAGISTSLYLRTGQSPYKCPAAACLSAATRLWRQPSGCPMGTTPIIPQFLLERV